MTGPTTPQTGASGAQDSQHSRWTCADIESKEEDQKESAADEQRRYPHSQRRATHCGKATWQAWRSVAGGFADRFADPYSRTASAWQAGLLGPRALSMLP